MSSTAAPLVSWGSSFPTQTGVWTETEASTDANAWRALQPKRKYVEASTLGNTFDLAVQTRTSTLPVSNKTAHDAFGSLFSSAPESRFEDGIESNFSRHLISLVQGYGSVSKDILGQILEDKSTSPESLSEAMRWLGRMEDAETYESRLWLLEKALTSSSPAVRDGASLGLASMDDPQAAPYLEAAIDVETIPELRRDMEEVLGQLTNGR